MKKIAVLFLLIMNIISCQNKKVMEQEFEWEEKKGSTTGVSRRSI
ncbi:hypothetical protein Ornrh_1750 [Ornithobacterium rhinotracheale DSM 15997]|uniref:Uncharacterized protein n=1 Tax=Ornithobacterium rhinotracheale (strain ATCC 51463 / DSM 15997 / CCUG 23171 / CIP 104009 / LMG 9086) TaxID=867902 RepID=I4A1S0_ORNRL|nr:hypothetical protein Ornrh_1750 [Ornithobacterium rhinotracheale DSM 15997]